MDLNVGDQVSIKTPLPYLKTSDPMPMLRPSELVSQNELGKIVGIRSKGVLEVRFRQGTFLIASDRLKLDESNEN